MDGLITALLKHLLATGAGTWGILCAILLFFIYYQHKAREKTADRLYTLSTASIEAMVESTNTLEAANHNLEQQDRDLDRMQRTLERIQQTLEHISREKGRRG